MNLYLEFVTKINVLLTEFVLSNSKVNLENKHIAFVIDSMNGGGAENVCLTLARELLAKQYRVDLVLLRYRGELLLQIPHDVNLYVLVRKFRKNQSMETLQPCSMPFENIQWIERPVGMKDCVYSTIRFLKSHQYTFSFHPRPRLRNFFWTASLDEYMRKEQPSLIFSYLLRSITVCLLARRFSSCDVPLICSFRNTLDSLDYIGERGKNIQMKYLKHLLPDTEKVHANSQGVADSIVNHIPAVRNKVVPILNPIRHNVTSLSTQSISHKWLSSESRSESNTFPNIILAAGRLAEQKNFLMLIRAFAEVRSQLDVRLILLGEGPQREQICDLIYSLNIEEYVSMPGWVDNPYSFMAKADLFVLSSSWEGCPNVLLEALACGCPVVSTDCPSGPSEILEHGRWGRLVPVNDQTALAEAIIATLKDDRNQDALRQRAVQFAPENMIEKFETLIREVIFEYKAAT